MTGPRILILSLYYRPDLSACSFRTTALVDALRKQSPESRICVITSLPNRYSSFSSQAPEEESDGSLTIRRIRLPPHQSHMVDQARAFACFSRTVARLVAGARYDLVYATSSRLMTAALGARTARRLGAPLYLDIRDIFADTIKDVLPRGVSLAFKIAFSAVERVTIRSAVHVNLVSKGFESYFAVRYPNQSFSYFTNGIDEEFLTDNVAADIATREPAGPLMVVYAGNMGEGQGLHSIIPTLAPRMSGRVRFRLIGDGGRRVQLEKALANRCTDNVEVFPPMSRERLMREYQGADVLFLHLNDYNSFKRVLPSKVFEYGALGKPIWAGVAGYAAQFLEEEISNAAVFPPCDADQAVAAFERLAIRHSSREAFREKFARTAIMRAMAAHILSRARHGGQC